MAWFPGKQAADQKLQIITTTAKHKAAAAPITRTQSTSIKLKHIHIGHLKKSI